MIITLGEELATAILEAARRRGVAPEHLAVDALRGQFLAPGSPIVPQDEWERQLFSSAIDCGISLPDSAFSSDELYD